MPQVEPAAEPASVVIAKPREVRPAIHKLRAVVKKQAQPSKPAGSTTAPKLWTSWESGGASGRMVRIGTYPTRLQAKRAWGKLVKVYPGMGRLRAVTTDIP